MERRRVVLAVAALLVVAALGFTATAIDQRATGGTGGEEQPAPTSDGRATDQTLTTAIVVTVIALAVGGVAYAVYQESIPRWLAVTLVVAVVVLLVLLGLGYILEPPDTETNTTTNTTPEPAETPAPAQEESGGGDTGGGLSPTTTLAVLGLLLLVGALSVARFSVGGTAPEEEEEAPNDAAAVSEAAGRAADELEETTLSNAIYRAWNEMTEALDVADPETTTPAEFEEAAVAAGIDRTDAATLTELFREVRYGDAPATDEREQRAREALRSVERDYSAGASDEGIGSDADDSGGDDQ